MVIGYDLYLGICNQIINDSLLHVNRGGFSGGRCRGVCPPKR